jgi:hypothetical protein
MIKENNFHFKDLVINHGEVKAVLGYKDEPLPAPFDTFLDEALNEVSELSDIRTAYSIVDDIKIIEKGASVTAAGLDFKVGKTVHGELKGSERLAFFVCTAGKTISEKSARLLKGEDPVLGYVYDVLGSAIVEAAGDRMQSFLQEEISKSGYKITNRYSPGYCHWDVSDQHKLFSLFGGSACGVSLTPSSLMHPVKSISGIIGIGPEVRYREYQCTLCLSEFCIYRNMRGV